MPGNLVLPTNPSEFSPGLLGKLMAGLGIVTLLSLLVYLFIVSLTASRWEGRPWTWSMGFHMAFNKVFGFALMMIFLFFQALTVLLLLSLVLGLVSGGKEEWIPLILIVQLVGMGVLSFYFLPNYCLVPQVLLLEHTPGILSLKRARALAKGQQFKLLGFFALSYGPVLLPQLYLLLATMNNLTGLNFPENEMITLGITIYTQVVSLLLIPFIFAGTTVFYYRARAKEVNLGT